MLLIRTKVRFFAMLIGVAAVLLLFATYQSAKNIRGALLNLHDMDMIVLGLFDLNLLSAELDSTNIARVHQQWDATCAAIDESLKNAENRGRLPSRLDDLTEMRTELKVLWDSLEESAHDLEDQRQKRSLNQLQIQVRNMSAASHTILDSLYAQVTQQWQTLLYVVIGWSAFLIFLGVALYALVTRTILTPLLLLQQDAATIGGGNLSHRAESGSGDEIGDLADALNAMSGQLATTLVSKHELETSEERFRRFFEAGLVGNAVIAPDKKWLLVNDRLCNSLGYSSEELVTSTWEDLTHPEDLPKESELFHQVLTGELEGYELDKRFVRKNGEIMHAKLVVRSTFDKNDSIDHCVVMVEDITERVHAREALSAAMDNVKRSNDELEQFAYVASHDLQEPLRMVSSYTQLLNKRYADLFDKDGKEFLAFIVDGAVRMQKLINDLLAFSRVNRQAKEVKIVDTHSVLAQVRSNLTALIEEKHAMVTNETLPEIRANELQLVQLFQNLIQNAMKFVPDDRIPLIHVSAEQRNNSWVFMVKDNGIGIAPEYQDRVFQIFQRLHTRSEYEGTGIGLAICKRIVECHGGQIWFESTENEGTTFLFKLTEDTDK